MYPYTPDPYTSDPYTSDPYIPNSQSCIPYTPPVSLLGTLAAALADRGSLFFNGRHEWAGHVFDWAEAQREQAYWDRQDHDEECICGICYWMDMEGGRDCVGNAGSRNVFLNSVFYSERQRLMRDLLGDPAFCKFIGNWSPMKS